MKRKFSINKNKFIDTCLKMKAFPENEKVVNEYIEQVQILINMLMNYYNVPYDDRSDISQTIFLNMFKRSIHSKIDSTRDPFSLYWNDIKWGIYSYNREKNKRPDVVSKVDIFEDAEKNSENYVCEDDMIRYLSFKLEDYDAFDGAEGFENGDEELITEVFVEGDERVKGRRGRKKIRKEGELAPHWEFIFKYLQEKKQVHIDELLNMLPKGRKYKNPEQSLKLNLYTIARRENVKIKINNKIVSLTAR